MRFRGFAESLLGSKVKVKILRYILREETITSERELAEIIGVSHGAVNKAMKDFQDLNLVIPFRIGNVISWQVNRESFAYTFIPKELFSPIDRLKQEIKTHLEHLGTVKKVVIYGSIAEGRELSNSDIDLFILVEKEENKKTILPNVADITNKCVRLFGNKISPNIFLTAGKKSRRNKQFLDNIASKGIVVFER